MLLEVDCIDSTKGLAGSVMGSSAGFNSLQKLRGVF